ncbi:MAG TPA: diguanylate cyclase, partial [Acidimicrobiia bacterium]|nr:diguanylate cyclase [Acidimicrobiia bacterium]
MRVDRYGTVRRWDAAEATFGWNAAEVLGRPVREIWPEIDRACRQAFEGRTPTVRTAACLVNPDGSCVPADVIAAAFGRRARRGVWILATPTNPPDVTPGLLDRASFTGATDAALAAGTGCSVIVIEASGVEALNQAVGHAAGDELLRTLGERLATSLPAGAVATRYASRFAVLVADGADAHGPAAIGAAMAGALDASVAMTTGVVRPDLHVGASRPGPGDDAASLLRHA